MANYKGSDKSMKAFNINSKMKDELLNLYKCSHLSRSSKNFKIIKKKEFQIILFKWNPSLLNELVKSNNLDNLFDDLFSIEGWNL